MDEMEEYRQHLSHFDEEIAEHEQEIRIHQRRIEALLMEKASLLSMMAMLLRAGPAPSEDQGAIAAVTKPFLEGPE